MSLCCHNALVRLTNPGATTTIPAYSRVYKTLPSEFKLPYTKTSLDIRQCSKLYETVDQGWTAQIDGETDVYTVVEHNWFCTQPLSMITAVKLDVVARPFYGEAATVDISENVETYGKSATITDQAIHTAVPVVIAPGQPIKVRNENLNEQTESKAVYMARDIAITLRKDQSIHTPTKRYKVMSVGGLDECDMLPFARVVEIGLHR